MERRIKVVVRQLQQGSFNAHGSAAASLEAQPGSSQRHLASQEFLFTPHHATHIKSYRRLNSMKGECSQSTLYESGLASSTSKVLLSCSTPPKKPRQHLRFTVVGPSCCLKTRPELNLELSLFACATTSEVNDSI